MAAKKKVPVKVQKSKSSETKEPVVSKDAEASKKSPGANDQRGSVTTVESMPNRGNNLTTRPSESAPKIPAEKAPPSNPVRIEYPVRERRINIEGRRGRFAQKSPPGTRTKMLKIIYDRKADMAKKKQNALIGKLVLAVVMTASVYYGAQHAFELTTRGFAVAIEWLDWQSWWSNVASKSPAPRTYNRQQTTKPQLSYPKQHRVRPVSTNYRKQRAVTRYQTTIKKPHSRQIYNRKATTGKVMYGQTSSYRGQYRSNGQ